MDVQLQVIETVLPSGICLFLSVNDVVKRVRLSRTTIWRREKEGTFPPRRQISKNRVGWLESDIAEWEATRPLGGPNRIAEGSKEFER